MFTPTPPDQTSGPPPFRRVPAVERLTPEGFSTWLQTPRGAAIYSEFVRTALTLRRRGWRHAGARMIVEYIRFSTALSDGPDALVKVDNGVAAYAARRAMSEQIELREPHPFFELRRARADGALS